nr:hypothetical protein [Vulcanimicrobium alpinum]
MNAGFMPHGLCFLWQPGVLTLHVVSDALVALAPFSIPALLVWFVRRRRDVPFSPIFWMFSLFIVSCGCTHLISIWVIWHPAYWFEGAAKATTALASVATAAMLVPLLPRAIALRSPVELDRLNAILHETLVERDSRFAVTSVSPHRPHAPGRVASDAPEAHRMLRSLRGLPARHRRSRNRRRLVQRVSDERRARGGVGLRCDRKGSRRFRDHVEGPAGAARRRAAPDSQVPNLL